MLARSSAADWPAISKEELAMTDDPANPGAAAILLYREVTKNRSVLHENDSHVCETSGQYPAWRF
jgi:hypothetical protein